MFESTFEVTLIGEIDSVETRSTFGYRMGVGIDPSNIPFFGAQPLAEEFIQEVLPKFKDCVSDEWNATAIEVKPHNASGLFVLTLPYVQQITGVSGGATGPHLGTASCVTMRANLEPMLLIEGFVSPKRGWLTVGPLTEAQVDLGRLTDTWFIGATAKFREFAVAAAANLESIDPPAIYYPVRLRRNKILGFDTVVGYSDILDWQVDPRMKMRRSRQPEN